MGSRKQIFDKLFNWDEVVLNPVHEATMDKDISREEFDKIIKKLH